MWFLFPQPFVKYVHAQFKVNIIDNPKNVQATLSFAPKTINKTLIADFYHKAKHLFQTNIE